MTIQANQGFGVSIFGATSAGGGGSTSPGGSSGQLQYNASGSFGGMAGTSWDDTNRALTLTGATVTTSQPVLNLSQTWNAAGVTFTGLKFNATDTASASGSLLLDLQVGGTSKFIVDKNGYIGNTNGIYIGSSNSSAATNLTQYGLVQGSTSSITWRSGSTGTAQDLFLIRAAAATLQLGNTDAAAPVAQTLQVQSVVSGSPANTAGANFSISGSKSTGNVPGGSINFYTAPAGASGTSQNALQAGPVLTINAGPNGTANGTAGGITGYDGTTANTLALRNGTNAQEFRVYNSYTDASNNEYLRFLWSSNTLYINTQKSGTGTLRDIVLTAGGNLYLGAGGIANNWKVDGATGNLVGTTDNTNDIGASGANRPRNVYVATGIVAGTGQLNSNACSSNFIVAGNDFSTSGKSRITSSVNGNWTLVNNASTDFSLLQFGGTTSSFPALKRSTTTLQVRLADDSAFADIGARGVIHNGVTFANLPGTPTTGTVAYVTDASNAGAAWGDSVTAGGSTNKYLVWYNGTNWTVVGK